MSEQLSEEYVLNKKGQIYSTSTLL